MLKELLVSFITSISPAAADLPDQTVGDWQTDQAYCLAENVYHEARNQPAAGQMAVMSVTMNRVKDPRFPNTICEVVREGPHRPSWKGTGEMIPVRHRCQFSWYCDGKSDEVKDKKSYKKILDFARLMMHNDIRFVDITDGATHYHADYVSPSWAKTKTRTTEIGDHIFYRWERK